MYFFSILFSIPEIQATSEGVYITSPYFPDPGYPADFDFTWFLTADPGSLVGLKFEGLYLDYEEDYLYIGTGRHDDINTALYNFTGFYEVLRILPTNESLWLRLVTNEDKGYSAGFKVLAYSTAEPGNVKRSFSVNPCMPNMIVTLYPSSGQSPGQIPLKVCVSLVSDVQTTQSSVCG